MFLTDVTMIPIIAVLLIFLMSVWLRSEHLHYFGHYFRRQPARHSGHYRSHRPTIG